MTVDRKSIAEKAMKDAVAHLVAAGYSITPEQLGEVIKRLGPPLAQMMNEEPPEALDLLAFALTLQTVGEVLGLVRPPPPDPFALGIELAELGGREAAARVVAGGYAKPTDAQHREIVTATRKRVESLLRAATDPEAARAKLREFIDIAVRVVLGPPPAWSQAS